MRTRIWAIVDFATTENNKKNYLELACISREFVCISAG